MFLPLRSIRLSPVIFLCLVSALWADQADDESPAPKAREFLFTYAAKVTGLTPNQVARIWLPVPPSDSDQQVSIAKKELPTRGTIGKETKYGNQVLYMEARANRDGQIPLSVTYRVKRNE